LLPIFLPVLFAVLPSKVPIDSQYEISIYWHPIGEIMDQRTDVFQGTLGLMILKTLDAMGAIHGYGIARRIEQISGDQLSINYGTIYPALLKLEQEGCISSEWGVSDNNRKAKYYKITRSGRKQLLESKQGWEQTKAILDRFLALGGES
jgi:PadR family transcriptional regulator, regulatory protein PadR